MQQKKKAPGSVSMEDLMGEIDAQFDGFKKGFTPGEMVQGTVISIGSEYIVLDIHSKIEGIVSRIELNPDDKMPVVGDVMSLYFVEMRDGAARLTPKLTGSGAAMDASIRAAYEKRMPLEGTVEKEVNGGYEVRIGGERAFCPFSQISGKRSREDEESPVGRKMTFMVSEFDSEDRTLVVSHREVLELEREVARESLMEELKVGDVRTGIVTAVMPFGAFVDIGGAEGLIPLKELSWDRNAKSEDLISNGQQVTVEVTSIDWEANRLSFSMRNTQADPWQEFAEEYEPGQFLTVTVSKLMPFGAFVSIEPGVEGLIPISKLGNGRRITHPREVLKEGDVLDVQIESIDPLARRASLSPVVTAPATADAGGASAVDEAAREEAEMREKIKTMNKTASSLGTLGDVFGQLKI